jgi:hypothetical protein
VLRCRGRAALHALTWCEAWAAYEPSVPAAELAQRAPELMIDYDFTCRVIRDRIVFLARFAGRPLPD